MPRGLGWITRRRYLPLSVGSCATSSSTLTQRRGLLFRNATGTAHQPGAIPAARSVRFRPLIAFRSACRCPGCFLRPVWIFLRCAFPSGSRQVSFWPRAGSFVLSSWRYFPMGELSEMMGSSRLSCRMRSASGRACTLWFRPAAGTVRAAATCHSERCNRKSARPVGRRSSDARG